MAEADPDGTGIGRLAVERGLITAAELREALQERSVRLAAGAEAPLGELLVDLELITPTQLEALHAAAAGGDASAPPAPPSSAAAPRPSPAQPIPGFELLRKLGEGAMGATYLARQLSLGRLVALKALKRSLARDGEFVERFRREARLAGKLDHPNIVRTYDAGEAGGFHYLLMEYIEGRSAYDAMPDVGGMSEDRALDICLQVARALDAAEAQGIVHRDVKPENIMVSADGTARLCDFGLARQSATDARLTQTGMAVGTPSYISPEQARGSERIDIRADIYSLGATLYRLATGASPYDGPTAAVVMTRHLTEPVPWAADANPEVSEGCCRLIQKMMAKEAAARYQTPAELVADMERVAQGLPPLAASGLRAPERRPRPLPAGTGASGTAFRLRSRRERTRFREDAGTVGRLMQPVAAGRRRFPAALTVAAAAAVLLLAAAAAALALLRRGPGGGPEQAPAELAARAAWDRTVAPTVRRPMTAANARALLAALEEFESAHLATRFRQSRLEEGLALRREAEEALRAAQFTRPAPSDKVLAQALEAIAARWRERPGDYGATVSRLEELCASAGAADDKTLLWKAQDLKAEVERARTAAADAAFAALRERSGALAAAGDFDAAVAALTAVPGELSGLLAGPIARERAALDRQARASLEPACAAAERHLAALEPAEALAQLDRVAGVKYAPLDGRRAALRAEIDEQLRDRKRLEAERLAREAAGALDRVLSAFEERALAGQAHEAAEGLRRDRAALPKALLRPEVVSMLDAAGRVAARLAGREGARAGALAALAGKDVGDLRGRDSVYARCRIVRVHPGAFDIEYDARLLGERRRAGTRVTFAELADGEIDRLAPLPAPEDADGHVAAALAAAAGAAREPGEARRRESFAAAARAIEAAGGHPLVPRCRGLLRTLQVGRAEAAAEAEWRSRVEPLIRPEPSGEKLRRLIAAIDAWGALHGTTAFAKDQAAEIARLRQAAGGSIEQLRKVFRGRVVRFDPATREVELVYDFEDAAQLADWEGGVPGESGSRTLLVPGRGDGYRFDAITLRAPIEATRLEFTAAVEPPTEPPAKDQPVPPAQTSWWMQARNARRVYQKYEKSGLCGCAVEAQPKPGSWLASAEVRTCAASFQPGQRFRVVTVIEGGTARWLSGDAPVAEVKFAPAGDRLGLGTRHPGMKCHFDDIRIVGRLNQAWLEAALKLAERPVAWQGTWTKMKAVSPPYRSGATAFDTKRGWYIVRRSDGFEMHAYGLQADRFEKLCDEVAGDGEAFPRRTNNPATVYDPERDGVTMVSTGFTLLFDMARRRWSVLAKAGCRDWPALELAGGRLYMFSNKGYGEKDPALFRFDPDKSAWEPLPGTGPPYRLYSGTIMGFDPPRKRLLLFSGCELADTWSYDLAGGGGWQELRPVESPPAGLRHSICHDPGNDVTIMGGSSGLSSRRGDVWVYDHRHASWFRVRPLNEGPSAPTGFQYDPANRCFIAGSVQESGRLQMWTLRISPAAE